MINRSTVRSLTVGFQHAIYKILTIVKKLVPNGGANPKRSFHGRRALNAQAVQRLIADQPAGNSGSDCSAISAAVADEYNVITY
ncbi:unnamed protein product [Rhizoctonia solani]|uniref:Uncharacterized protein n=1 Tax=Rhizoctonia solani TaxID=456999 RepID=A0A8H3CWL8_9AGAM|nr:unnamed protein product [Rhizoctonia solani]